MKKQIKDNLLYTIIAILIIIIISLKFKEIVDFFYENLEKSEFFVYSFVIILFLSTATFVIFLIYLISARFTNSSNNIKNKNKKNKSIKFEDEADRQKISNTAINIFTTLILIFVTLGFLLTTYQNTIITRTIIDLEKSQDSVMIEQNAIIKNQTGIFEAQNIIQENQAKYLGQQNKISRIQFELQEKLLQLENNPPIFIHGKVFNETDYCIYIENMSERTVMHPTLEIFLLVYRDGKFHKEKQKTSTNDLPFMIMPHTKDSLIIEMDYFHSIVQENPLLFSNDNESIQEDTKNMVFIVLNVKYRRATGDEFSSTARVIKCSYSAEHFILQESIDVMEIEGINISEMVEAIESDYDSGNKCEYDIIFFSKNSYRLPSSKKVNKASSL